MFELRAFQDAFGRALASSGPMPDWACGDPAMARAIAVHRNTSTSAALDALQANYPVIHALVGHESFNACALRFLEAHPVSDPRLCRLGEGLDDFLTRYEPFLELSYLADVAKLERLCNETLFAADAPELDAAALSEGLDLDTVLALHPATRLADQACPAASLWLAHQPDARSGALEDIVWRGEAVVVTRPSGRLCVTAIDPAGLAFLTACAAGEPIGLAAASAAEAGGDVAALFSTLLSIGAFQALQPNEAGHAK